MKDLFHEQCLVSECTVSRTPPTRTLVKGMDISARLGRFNKWVMLIVYPFYLYLVRTDGLAICGRSMGRDASFEFSGVPYRLKEVESVACGRCGSSLDFPSIFPSFCRLYI